jgi:hypothetical protein
LVLRQAASEYILADAAAAASTPLTEPGDIIVPEDVLD